MLSTASHKRQADNSSGGDRKKKNAMDFELRGSASGIPWSIAANRKRLLGSSSVLRAKDDGGQPKDSYLVPESAATDSRAAQVLADYTCKGQLPQVGPLADDPQLMLQLLRLAAHLDHKTLLEAAVEWAVQKLAAAYHEAEKWTKRGTMKLLFNDDFRSQHSWAFRAAVPLLKVSMELKLEHLEELVTHLVVALHNILPKSDLQDLPQQLLPKFLQMAATFWRLKTHYSRAFQLWERKNEAVLNDCYDAPSDFWSDKEEEDHRGHYHDDDDDDDDDEGDGSHVGVDHHVERPFLGSSP